MSFIFRDPRNPNNHRTPFTMGEFLFRGDQVAKEQAMAPKKLAGLAALQVSFNVSVTIEVLFDHKKNTQQRNTTRLLVWGTPLLG